MKKLSAAALLVVSVVFVLAAIGMQAGDTSLTQLVAQLAAKVDALSARVETLEQGGGAPPAAQGVVASAGAQRGPIRTMVVDNIQQSDHNDDNSDEIHQLQVEVNSLQNTLRSQQDNLEQTTGQAVQTSSNVGGEVSNRSDIDRQIGAQRDTVERYATQLGIKQQQLDQLQQAENQPKQILHGHNGQMLIMLQSKFNISGQLSNVAPGDTVTWAGNLVKSDDNMEIWLVDIVKEAQQQAAAHKGAMAWQGYFTAGVLAALIAALVSRRIGADVAFLCALAALLLAGILKPSEAVAGFANPAVISVGLLYVVAQGLQVTGGMTAATWRLLGHPASERAAQVRLLVPVAALSAFINNTPVVVMFLPVLRGWSRRTGINASRLYMPLSFAALLGGTCTLIGTSTNLVVNGLLEQQSAAGTPGVQPMEMFTLAKVGVPVAVAGLALIILFSRYLLPARGDRSPDTTDPRQYTVWMKVKPESPLVGRTIERAGLRHLRGLFVTSIERGEETLSAVGPEHVLLANDVLRLVGEVDSVVDLQQFPGLVPETEQINKLAAPRYRRRLTEAVVSESSPLIGKSVREGEFRTRYNAVIIAVHRAGERVRGKIGDIVLRPGDTLLLEATPGFAQHHRNSAGFYLVSELPEAPTPRWGLAWVALGLFVALIAAITTELLDVMPAVLCCALLMILTRCCTGTQARQAVDWQVLVIIGAAFGLARAMETTGFASLLAHAVFGWSSGLGIYGALAGVFAVTVLLTAFMSNNAAAVLIFPLALEFALEQGFGFMPFAVCVAIGASTDFMTPFGYQTNLMVTGPGGYTWGDFLRLGAPLTLLTGILCVWLAPIMYR